ncbi:MAG: polyprenyl synthetase family protein [Planctomycetota bacterium]
MALPRPERTVERQAQLAEIYAPIESELRDMEASLAAELSSPSEAVRRLLDHVSRYRGKRLRPALVFLSGKATGWLKEEHVRLAVIIELIHTATLVHDDILDDASTRRGVPSINAIYTNEVPVLLGDLIYARAFSISTGLADQTASRLLSDVTQVICRGEIDQIFARGEYDLPEKQYFKIIEDKTAALYAASAQLGAHYAGARAEVAEAMWRYGLNLGIAFQIIDDCLDLTGIEGVVGKSLGTDLEKGKMTLPLIHLASELEGRERDRLVELLGDASLSGKREQLRDQFDLTMSLAYAQGKADSYVRRALSALPPLPESPSSRSFELIARYVLERDR